MCNFGDISFLKGRGGGGGGGGGKRKNVKPGKNAIFLKKGQNNNFPLKYRLKT